MTQITTNEIGDLFAFSTQDGGVVKIPKAALPGLSPGQTVTAAQFFASVLVRGMAYYPQAPTWQDNHKISVNAENTVYIDFPENRLVSLFQTSIEFSTINLEGLK